MAPPTVGDVIAVATELGSDLSKLDRLLALTLLLESQEPGYAGEFWADRYHDILAGDDDDEMGVLLATGYDALQAQELPPLLFDGAAADLEDFNSPKPSSIACGPFTMPAPTNAMAIAAATKDPSLGVAFTFSIMEQASGWEREELFALPQSVFFQIEEAVAFLFRRFILRITAVFA